MSLKSFPVAWQSGPHRFVGKAYIEGGQFHLSGASTGPSRRRRTITLDGRDIITVSTLRVSGQPGLAVDHGFGRLEMELLAGSWGAAHDLAAAIRSTMRLIPQASAIPHRLFHELPEPVAARYAPARNGELHAPTKEVRS